MANPSSPVVHTKSGSVQGSVVKLPNSGIEVCQFLGIPYAEPPVGELRFRKPVPKQPWEGVLKATEKPNCCPQLKDDTFGDFEGINVWNPNTEISEDSLYLNIWVPKAALVDKQRKYPVLIWIYGGSFLSGSASLDLYNGAILAGSTDIIVVAMNYRLGSLGFLYFGTDDAPGNMGMWDQVLAMKWTSENIGSFGGDCQRTTLCGESAGAAAVGLHLLSPHSKSYFQRAIMQSASALCDWAIMTAEEGLSRSSKLAEVMIGSNSKTKPGLSEKMELLRSIPCMEFPAQDSSFDSGMRGGAPFAFVPVVDGDFLPRHPRQLLADGQFNDVPVLAGFNKTEGSYLMVYSSKGMAYLDNPKQTSEVNITQDKYGELLDDCFGNYPVPVRDAIEFNYTPWHLPAITSDDYIGALEKAVGDWAFTCPVLVWAHHCLRHAQPGSGKIFLYRFSHRSSVHPWPSWMGVMHGDDVFFLYGDAFKADRRHSDDEKALSQQIMTYWSNFAKSGDPNVGDQSLSDAAGVPLWPEYSAKKKEVLELNIETVINKRQPPIVSGLKTKECIFWAKFIPKLQNAFASD